MFRSSVLLNICVVVLLSLAVARAQFRLKHEAPRCIVDGAPCTHYDWRRVGPSPSETPVRLVFALKMKNLDKLDAIFHQVSDPHSAQYGQFLSLHALRHLTTDAHAVRNVTEWLTQNGILDFSSTGDFVIAKTDALTAGRLLNTQFFAFQSPSTHLVVHRALNCKLPSYLFHHLDFVGDVTTFPQTSALRHRHRRKGVNDTTPVTTLSLINQVYQIPSNVIVDERATQSLYESLGQDFSDDDLKQFFKDYVKGAKPPKVAKVVGPNDQSGCKADPNNCGEANLDVQYIMAVAQGSPTTYWSMDSSTNFLDWILAVASDPSPPLVHSISYGEDEGADDASMLDRFNVELQKAATRGLTVMVSSGDDGVAGASARGNSSACGFSPSFPASSPYVTAVGATMGPEMQQTEVACTSDNGGLITTGGGFSLHYATPDWQSANVQSYLSNAPQLPPTSEFNSQGRGYPDVAVMGHNYVIIDGGQKLIGSGTSASSPVFAAMVSLVNAARFQAGKKPLGFLNPVLYQLTSDAFIDITSGRNNCAAGHPGTQTCCPDGFTAISGWDPVTGLGAINFPSFLRQLLAV
eukprot:gnl/Spiro4/6300_TR3237_c0_g1_i1.p1 gnl/Spiro4/6300_TR3237_c0_g1~~gnl/Spiro4/6300_TR3237_c0_g1_i1.p1  ORF type:complete len:578 (+),score=194.89 gnl/Spiro4/6300_TR3237_c0_g1_i1:139-1872(+)